MAEFKDVIHIFNQYCSEFIKSGRPCHQCYFHYLKNADRSGCINFLVHYPEDAERFLLEWEKPDEVCTMCGKQLDEMDKQEDFGFDYYVGYGSKYDCEHIKAKFCCDCFDKIIDHIVDKSIHNPVICEYAFHGETAIPNTSINNIYRKDGEKGE